MADETTIRQALEMHLAAMPGALPTVWQNKTPPAALDLEKPYQKAHLLRSGGQSVGLSEKTTVHRGILQVSLCYPTGDGTIKIETQAVALQAHFKGRVLTRDGVKIKIRGKPEIGGPVSTSPYVVPVSIRYESTF